MKLMNIVRNLASWVFPKPVQYEAVCPDCDKKWLTKRKLKERMRMVGVDYGLYFPNKPIAERIKPIPSLCGHE